MPTITRYFGVGLVNNGPLTTTYTPPASCTTVTTDHIVFANASYLPAVYGAPTCETSSMGDCLPSGSYDKHQSEWRKNGGQGTLDYYSPGVVCPKGWTTAGTLAHGDKTGSAEKSGIFTFTRSIAPGVQYIEHNLQLEKLWLEALGPSETLAYCCPSGWVSGIRGGCYSSIEPLESASYSTLCNLQVPRSAIHAVTTVEASSMSNYIWSAATAELSTFTEAISALPTGIRDDGIAIVRHFPAVKLVYKESDLKSSGEGGKSDDKETNEAKNDDDNGAARPLMNGGFFSIIAVLFSMLFGAGMIMF
ncbi:hypothetical protein FBEOM_8361 [Fusarium beomiforme]|uniref:Uncharacterized protein n=1 Tax=Fusarium beomiforme TaxID=44412 RepID=A0A9P5AFH2_9HYPO|nr:hypothetical protein FBEOM_8361 [Fusarium beomiforme]